MGKYSLELTEIAREDMQRLFKSGNKALIKKIIALHHQRSYNNRLYDFPEGSL